MKGKLGKDVPQSERIAAALKAAEIFHALNEKNMRATKRRIREGLSRAREFARLKKKSERLFSRSSSIEKKFMNLTNRPIGSFSHSELAEIKRLESDSAGMLKELQMLQNRIMRHVTYFAFPRS